MSAIATVDFSRSGLADQSQAFARAEVETYAVDRPHSPQRRVVVNPKVAHLEDNIIAQVRELSYLGTAASSCRTYGDPHQRSPFGRIDASTPAASIADRLAIGGERAQCAARQQFHI